MHGVQELGPAYLYGTYRNGGALKQCTGSRSWGISYMYGTYRTGGTSLKLFVWGPGAGAFRTCTGRTALTDHR